MRTIVALFIACTALPACTDDEDGQGGDSAATSSAGGAGGGGETAMGGADASGGGGADPNAIDWQPCPLITDGTGNEAECAILQVPASYDDPDGPTVDFSVKRLLAAQQPSRGQVWFLQGGPGGSVVDFEPYAEYLADFEPTLDWYMPEHRGVGLSSRLSCPEEESDDSEAGSYITLEEMPSCIDYLQTTWGDSLAGFTTENAAKDLGETIERTRAPDQDVFVYGISYGSQWGHRYLQIYADQATGVTLAAIAVNASFTQIDTMFDALGHRYFDACAADAFCATKLGPDPWARMTAVLAGLDAGTLCPEAAALGIDRTVVQALSASFFYSFDERTLIPPLVRRLERCGASDVNALTHLAMALSAPARATASERNESPLLGDHVGISEMWSDPSLTPEDAAAQLAQLNVATGATNEFASLFPIWPRYTPNPAYAQQLASTSIPILLQHGELDFLDATVYGPVADALDGPSQTFVLYPRSPHSPFDAVTTQGESCALRHFYEFIMSPTTPVDTSCLDDIVPLDFHVDPALASSIFGTSDAWEGDPGAAAFALPIRKADVLKRARRRGAR